MSLKIVFISAPVVSCHKANKSRSSLLTKVVCVKRNSYNQAIKQSRCCIMSVEQLVQYIVVRKDLIKDFGWSLGSLIAQGVHAAIAVNWKYRDDPLVREYCTQESQQMHTVVLETSDEAKLLSLAEQLDEALIKCVVWKEQPENVSTAIAIKPYPKDQVASYLKHLRLCR
ncbi:hypothetical protein GpartN1_g3578.t1 [Galdieria partita]|uniref:peptidyl-tRNA hydrolase n=1 Tax=Galdieria partita TaxID=83374 RepID=A0A9C7PYE4_9RHOD|nr:hypothetical protein GpartN1_g3578.t1 [Galdieria partita]